MLRPQEKREEVKSDHIDRRVPLVIMIAPALSDESIGDLTSVFRGTRIGGVLTTNTTISREAVASHALANEAGGLSRAPLTKASAAVLARLRRELDPSIPIIRSGGARSAAAARTKFEAGAELVQAYTGLVYRRPRFVRAIAEFRIIINPFAELH